MKRKKYALFSTLPTNEFSVNTMLGANQAAVELGADLVVIPMGLIDGMYGDEDASYYRYQYQYNVFRQFMDSNSFDGAVVEYASMVSRLQEKSKLEFLAELGDMPVVLIAEASKGYRSILFDNKPGLHDVIQHMITEHKCKKIGFVSGPKDSQDAQERLGVYRETLEENGLPYLENWVLYGNFTIYMQAEMREFIASHPDMDAIVCANDAMALCACDVMKEMGLEPGMDILVTGFDNQSFSILNNPALTTVKADARQLAYRAMKALAGEDDCSPVPTTMVVRQSCGCQRQLLYSDEGELIGLSGEQEFRREALQKIKDAERDQTYYDEMELTIREMVYYQDVRHRWMDILLKSFERFSCKKSYLFSYGEAIYHKYGEKWKIPPVVELRSMVQEGVSTQYEAGEMLYDMKTLFMQDIMNGEQRNTLFLAPLFYREKQLGFIATECKAANMIYIFKMVEHTRNTIEMIHVQEANRHIQIELQNANAAKSRFLANMSHEIRTPINAIVGMSEIIQREAVNPAIQNYAEDIQEVTDSLLSLVNEILDVTKIEENKMKLVPVEYHIKALLTDIVKQMRFRIKEKPITLELQLNDNIPSVLLGDDVRLRQVLINLLSNAIKYTNEGQVILRVEGRVVDGEALLFFMVKDTGIGIKEEDMKKLFEKFERIEEKRNRHIEGAGLGMNITASILALMDSKLNVKSVYGEGSMFSFVIKQPIIDETPIKLEVQQAAKHICKQKFEAPTARILLVDDIDMNRNIAKKLLQRTKIVVDEADNGAVCLNKCRKNRYDLILLDHMMPVMDGMETLAELRQMEGYRKKETAIIALTANAIDGAKENYLQAGFDSYLSKPILSDALESILMEYLPQSKIQLL